MPSSLITLSTAALALVHSTGAAAKLVYRISDVYDSSNFFDKFNFFVSRFNTSKPEDIDPTHGFVNYRSREDAKKLGLINVHGDDVFVGVNHADRFDSAARVGRDSVRLESTALYTHGLFIGDFAHLPTPACGSWPAL